MTRIVVADGHPTMRLGISCVLGAADDMSIVGETGEGGEILGLVEQERPCLVVLGLNLAGEPDGIEACRRLKALPEAPRVLIHAAYNFTEDVSSCLLAGADGYLHKDHCCRHLLDAVRRIAAGEPIWRLGGAMDEPGARLYATPLGNRLTPREREIAALVLRDCPNAEIAERHNLSLPTVKTHVRSVLRKLGVKNRRELLRCHHARG